MFVVSPPNSECVRVRERERARRFAKVMFKKIDNFERQASALLLFYTLTIRRSQTMFVSVISKNCSPFLKIEHIFNGITSKE